MSDDGNQTELEDGLEAKQADEAFDSEASTEDDSSGIEEVLPYPDRVPNSKKGASHSHSYVMIGLVLLMVLFSFIISNFTFSY